MSVVEMLYGLLAAWLALYGLNSLLLSIVYLWIRGRQSHATAPPSTWPSVTV